MDRSLFGTINAVGINEAATIAGTVQVVGTIVSSVSTGTTVMPVDNTIPQITEGDQYLTQAITPTNSASTLIITSTLIFSSQTAQINVGVALFQDATVNALAATSEVNSDNGVLQTVILRYKMTAGTTSATTFTVRAGPASANTITINGIAGVRVFGGVAASSIIIEEIKP